MKIEIEIPKEFERDFVADKFEDYFMRVHMDICTKDTILCGNYELETTEMFMKAFKNAKVVEE